MKSFLLKTGSALLVLILIAAVVPLVRLGLASWQVARTAVPEPFEDGIGSTTGLTILPLYEEAAVSSAYQSGHGVAYLIRTDSDTLLMDIGNNPEQVTPAPLLVNMQQAGITPDTAGILVISHNHPDHVGGLRAAGYRAADGDPLLQVSAAYAPQALTVAGIVAQTADQPRAIAPGIATLGRMPFVQDFPFWLWQPLGYEQVLAVNVAGHGLVLVTGCGHPSLERIVARAETLFAEPVVGVVGGLHYGEQTIATLAPSISFLAQRDMQLVALSPHDSEPDAIDAFRTAFPTSYRDIEVGKAIAFGTAVGDASTN